MYCYKSLGTQIFVGDKTRPKNSPYTGVGPIIHCANHDFCMHFCDFTDP